MPILKNFQYHSPTTIKEALNLLQKTKAPLLSGGGTFVLNHLKKTLRYPTDIISLKKISALHGIKDTPLGLSIGAMTTISELIESKLVKFHFPSLWQACQKLGTTPIRNMATIGGNLASRFFWVDLPAVLISLGGQVCLASSRGEKKMTVEEFLKSKSSKTCILTRIFLSKQARIAYYFRHTKTMEADIPSLALAFSAFREKPRLKRVALVVNTTSSLPIRLNNTEMIFQDGEPERMVLVDIQEALKKDLEKCKIDDYCIHCLNVDLEYLLSFLKKV